MVMVLKEVVTYYAAHGGSVYCAIIDAAKAFDRVEYCKLINSLRRRDLPRLVVNMYMNHATF